MGYGRFIKQGEDFSVEEIERVLSGRDTVIVVHKYWDGEGIESDVIGEMSGEDAADFVGDYEPENFESFGKFREGSDSLKVYASGWKMPVPLCDEEEALVIEYLD